VAVVVVLLLPGRILGYFWKDLLRGLRLLNAQEFAASKICSQRFLIQVQSKPWLKKLIWLGSGSYSRDPEALALNNLGAAEVQLGELVLARRHLDHAIEVDRLCPLPYYNIGALLRASGAPKEAERWFEQAARLGYKRRLGDKIAIAAQMRFASTDGRGR
jgi:tetratricopeptide (TPR) repeat protein